MDHELGHQEQRNTFRPGRRIRQFGQHQMDDVFRQVVLAAGDEDFGPADLVRTICLRLGLGANNPQVRTGMGLGQAHGTGPHTRVHIRQISGLQFVAGVGVDRDTGPGCQHRVQAERQAGGVDHFFDLGRYRLGHAHAAELGVTPHANPTAFSVGAIGIDETGRGGYRAIVPVATFFIAATTQRCDAFSGDLARFFEYGFNRFSIYGLCQRRQLRPKCSDLEDFIEDEAHIAQGRFVVSHGKPRNL